MVADISNYAGREQAYVKHYFLESYLQTLIHKTASAYDEVAYVDGFSGPWQSVGENFADTSFGIALAALRAAKQSWSALGRDIRMSAYLVEQNPASYRELEALRAKFSDIDIHTYNADFVATAPRILHDVPSAAFVFLFIDPKGWRIDFQQIAALLRRSNSEVVFNFMFDFINRAASINEPNLIKGLNALMPHGDWRKGIQAVPAESADASHLRKEALIEAFRESLRTVGNYRFVAEIPILRPLKDRTLYSLVYGTRHATGIQEFRRCHLKTEREQAEIRSRAKRVHRAQATGQPELFGPDVQFGPHEIEAFLASEKDAARATLLAMTPSAPEQTTYKDVWPNVLAKHAVTHSDLNKIASELRKAGTLLFPDWEPGKRVPQDHYRMARPASAS